MFITMIPRLVKKNVLQYWKDFTAGWRHTSLISLEATQSVTNVGIPWLINFPRSRCRGWRSCNLLFEVFRNEHEKAEFAIQVVREAKNMTLTLETRFASTHSKYLSRHSFADDWSDEQAETLSPREVRASTTFLPSSAHDARQSHRESCSSRLLLTAPWKKFFRSSLRKTRFITFDRTKVCLTSPFSRWSSMKRWRRPTHSADVSES